MSNEKWVELQKRPPSTLSDKELDEFIPFTWSKVAGNMQAQGSYQALVAEKSARQNQKTVRLSLWVSGLAVFFALSSLFFSILDWVGDTDWQKNQLEILSEQNSILQNVRVGDIEENVESSNTDKKIK